MKNLSILALGVCLGLCGPTAVSMFASDAEAHEPSECECVCPKCPVCPTEQTGNAHDEAAGDEAEAVESDPDAIEAALKAIQAAEELEAEQKAEEEAEALEED